MEYYAERKGIWLESYLKHELSAGKKNSQYDVHAKRLLKDKNILAEIMINLVPEFEEYTLEEARAAIEGEPEVGTVSVRPTDAIMGLGNESKLQGEGVLTFDVVFTALTKQSEQTKVYINLEAQGDFYPGYDLITRGIIYGARLISEQMDTEFTPKNYDDVKKVYSIWICMRAPKRNIYDEDVSDSILEYSIKPSILYQAEGNTVNPERWRYDILSVITLCLGTETIESKNRVIGLLSTVFSDKMDGEQKMKRLTEKYHLPISKELKEEVNVMCNISMALHSDLRQEIAGLKETITNVQEAYTNVREAYTNVQEAYENMQKENELKDAEIAELKRQLAEVSKTAR